MLMSYPTAIQYLEMEVSGCVTQIQELSVKVRKQDEELTMMRRGRTAFNRAWQYKHVLKDIIDELQVILQTRDYQFVLNVLRVCTTFMRTVHV